MIQSVLKNQAKFDAFVRGMAKDPGNTGPLRKSIEKALPTTEDYAELTEYDKILETIRIMQTMLQGTLKLS
jgi:hypothetical protein